MRAKGTCESCRFHAANPRGWQWDYCTRGGSSALCAEMRRAACGPAADLFEPKNHVR